MDIHASYNVDKLFTEDDYEVYRVVLTFAPIRRAVPALVEVYSYRGPLLSYTRNAIKSFLLLYNIRVISINSSGYVMHIEMDGDSLMNFKLANPFEVHEIMDRIF